MIKALHVLVYVPDSGNKSRQDRPHVCRTLLSYIRTLPQAGCHALAGEGNLSSLARTEIQGETRQNYSVICAPTFDNIISNSTVITL